MTSNRIDFYSIFGIPLGLSSILVLSNALFGGLFFHTIAEFFAIFIGLALFIVTWNTRKIISKPYLLFIGIGYFWLALLDLFHTLSYQGMPFFGVTDANIALHFWIYTRFLEAAILLIAPSFIKKPFNALVVFLVFTIIFLIVTSLSLAFNQPLFFIEGVGLANSKIYSEYVIIGVLILSALRLWSAKRLVLPKVLWLMLLSVFFTIIAELSFTAYVDVFGFSNQLGHIFKLFSFWMIYVAVIQTTLTSPFSLMSKAAHSYEVIPSPALILGAKGIILQGNKAAFREYNLVLPTVQNVHELSHPSDIPAKKCVLCQHLEKQQDCEPQLLHFSAQNQWRLVSLNNIENNGNLGFIQVSTDVTEQVQTKQELQLASEVFNKISEGILVTDENNNIIKINKAFEKITGYSEKEVIGKNPRLLSSGRQDKTFYKNMWRSINETGSWHGELWNRHKNGSVFPELASITKIHNQVLDRVNYVAAFSDISLLKGVEEQLEYVSHYDPLTNLPNKLLFNNILQTSMRHHHRAKEQIALLYVGVDNFSLINEQLGRTIGDAILYSISERFRSELRETDVFSRYGGDEFLILIEDVKLLNDVSFIAEKLLASLSKPIYYQKEMPIYVSASIGIALYPSDADNLDKLVQRANSAMIQVKKNEKNAYSFSSILDDRASERRLLVESQLRKAVENKELYVVYQPKVEAATHKIIGAEVLVRWKNKKLGEVYPDEFIPLAEAIGVIQSLTHYVLDQALKDFKQWREQFSEDLKVAVNFSSKEFKNKEVLGCINKSLEKFGVPSSVLEIEITEGLLLDKTDEVLNILNTIAAAGIHIAIDDFGTGYSSLSYLKKYPIHTVKIDKSFIDGVPDEEEGRVLVNTIILMAHGLGMKVVAEGIETKSQLDYYTSHQGDIVQGYYFSKPLKAKEFEAFLAHSAEGIILN